MADAATLTVRIGADISGLTTGLAGAKKKLDATFGPELMAMSRGVVSAVAGVGVALGLAGAASLKLAGDLEQSKIAFTTMLGSAEKAEAFLQELADFAARTPFELAGLQDASRKLIAFGFDSRDIIPIMTALGDAVAGLGGGAAEINRVTMALGQMQAKGKVSAEEMMQLAELGIPAWDILAKKIGVSVPEAMKMAEQGAISSGTAINGLIEGLNSRFGGMMDKQSRTFLGALSNLQDGVRQLSTNIGTQLLEAFNITGAIAAIATAISNLAANVKSTGLIGLFHQAFGPEMKSAILGIGVAITAAMVPAVASAVVALGTAVAAAAPFLGMAAAIAIAWKPIVEQWDEIGLFFQILWNDISGGVQWLYGVFRQVFDKIAGVVQKAVNYIRSTLGPLFNLLPKEAQIAMGGVVDAFAFGPKLIIGSFKAVGGAVTGVVRDTAGTASRIGSDLVSVFQKTTKQINGAVGSISVKPMLHLADSATKAGQAVAKGAGKVATATKAVTQEVRAAIPAIQGFTTVVDPVGAVMEDVWKQLDKAGKKAALLGKDFDLAGEQSRILNDALGRVADVGGPEAAAAIAALRQSIEATKPAQDGLTTSVNGFKQSTTDVLTAVTGLKDGLATIGETLGINLSNSFLDGAVKAGGFGLALIQVGTSVQALLPALASMWQSVVAALPALVTLATTTWASVVPAFTAWAAATVAATWPILAIVAAVAAVGVALVALWQNVEGFRVGVTAAWEAIAAGATAAFQGLAAVVGMAFGAVADNIKGQINFISSAINFLIRALNSIKIQVPSWVPKIGGMGWGGPGIPEIPMLAAGGVVDGAMQAVIGEAGPEAVVPLKPSVLAGIGEGAANAFGGGGGPNVTFNIRVDSRDAADLIVRKLESLGIRP